MSNLRTACRLFVPVPILAATMTLTHWAHSDPHTLATKNEVRLVCFDSGPATVRPSVTDTPTSNLLLVACQQSQADLMGQLGSKFASIVQPPFVVAGNLSQEDLQKHCRTTIQPATEALTREYFRAPVNEPVRILLIDDAATYQRYTKFLLARDSVSVYGFYSSHQKTLVVNLEAGAGTLVHELTHALIDFDFPEMPIWLNEGMASLFEQCELTVGGDDSQIVGRPNWRLTLVQQALYRGQLPPVSQMIETTNFRGEDQAMSYAHARTFCLFLQDRGLLSQYYHRLKQNHMHDPTGKETLLACFAGQGLEEIELEFRRWADQMFVATR